MIQRIQSVYLLLSGILFSALFFIPINEMIAGAHIIELNVNGIFEVEAGQKTLIQTLLPLFVLVVIEIALSLVSLFLYKKRSLQMRLVNYTAILALGVFALSVYFTYQVSTLKQIDMGFSPGLFIPLVAALFCFLAYKAIRKDDDLVRSVDRIR